MKHVYLLGAGFTRAIMGEKALLGDELMKTLNVSDYPEIFGLLEESDGIEEFFTRLDLQYIVLKNKNDALKTRYKEIRNEIRKQVGELFSVQTLNIEESEVAQELGIQFCKSIRKNTTLITLNYDCVLDQLLWQAEVWDPFRGYFYPTHPSVFGDTFDDYRRRLGDKYSEVSKKNITLLKLHGSLNFHFYKGTPYVEAIVTDSIFKGINTNFTIEKDEEVGPNILLLSYLKEINVDLFRAWHKAMVELQAADSLTIVGCSLRDEDRMLRFILSYFGKSCDASNIEGEAKKFQNKKLHLVDPDEATLNKIKKLVQNERLFLYPFLQENKIVVYGSLKDYLDQNQLGA